MLKQGSGDAQKLTEQGEGKRREEEKNEEEGKDKIDQNQERN